jgi:hypothetical protein
VDKNLKIIIKDLKTRRFFLQTTRNKVDLLFDFVGSTLLLLPRQTAL